MTEDDAHGWLRAYVSTDQRKLIDRYVDLLRAATETQNLIAPSTLSTIYSRHIVDSAQLVGLAPDGGTWVDIGSGAGLPGLVVAVVTDRPVVLIEPRKLRVGFLTMCVNDLDLTSRVQIMQANARNADCLAADVISARAVARCDTLFGEAQHIGHAGTTWVLPKGQSAQSEVVQARQSWHGVFHVKQSIVDPSSGIIVAQGVRRRR